MQYRNMSPHMEDVWKTNVYFDKVKTVENHWSRRTERNMDSDNEIKDDEQTVVADITSHLPDVLLPRIPAL